MSNEIKKVETTEIITDTGIIKLNPAIIKQYLVRGNGAVTNQEVMLFLSLCKFQKLNPFLNEAYLVKFGNAAANIIVGKDVFTKRAYKEPNFNGLQAGIIVERNGEVIELEGSCKMSKDILLGGWCKVYKKNVQFPFVSKVSMDEYNKKQSTWNQIPQTMIRKVAVVQALREAFPDLFQAMYSQEEMPVDQELVNGFDKIETPEECKVEEKQDHVEVEYTEVEENNQELTKKQIARLYTIADTRGLTKDATKQFMKDMFNIESAKELSLSEYEAFIEEIEKLEEVSKGE